MQAGGQKVRTKVLKPLLTQYQLEFILYFFFNCHFILWCCQACELLGGIRPEQ